MKLLKTAAFLFILFSVNFLQAQKLGVAKKSLKYLASDELEGRFPGTKGDHLAQAYIIKQFEKSGVASFNDSYLQEFTMLTSIERGESITLKLNGVDMAPEEDFDVLNFSSDGNLLADVINVKEIEEGDGIRFEDQWVLHIFNNENATFPGYAEMVNFASRAQREGAGGVIFVSLSDWSEDSEFYPFSYSRSMVRLNIPVIQLSREVLISKILDPMGLTTADCISQGKCVVFDEFAVEANVEIIENHAETGNVYGYVSADNSDEWMVLGAHYDHLGYGGYGSGSRSPELNEVHNGADDNASGASVVLMLADYYAKNPPSQNMLFVLFSAEEEGLIGSKYFVEHSPVDLSKIRAMINFDMVGRIVGDKFSISGTGTAKEFRGILETFQNKPLDIAFSAGGFSGSDQASFASENIPVLFFNSGLHDDYHRPGDDVSKINFKGIKELGKLSVALMDSLMHPGLSLTFVPLEQEGKSRHYGDMKVSLGIMPDVTGRVEDGLAVDGIRPGGSADSAGIQKGDVIHKVGKYEIGNIYDYMECLSKFEKGRQVVIELDRDGEEIQLEVKF